MIVGAYQFAVSGVAEENLSKIKTAVAQAASKGVRLLAVPECALTGYPPRDFSTAAEVDFAELAVAHEEIQTLVDQWNIHLILGTMTRDERGIRNTALILRPGMQPLYYHKRALWGWDRDNFIPGDEPGILEIDGLRVGVRICFEVRFPESFRELYRQQTELNVILFYDVTDRDDAERYDLLRGHIRTRAVENVCHTLTVNTIHPFQSAPTMLADRSGRVLFEAERGKESLLLFDFQPGPLNFGEQGRASVSDMVI